MKKETRLIESGSKSNKMDILKQKSMYMYRRGIPFKIIKSGSSYKLESGVYNQDMTFKKMAVADVSFIRKVKSYIKKNNIAYKLMDNVYTASDVKYIDVNKGFKSGDVIEDVICLDINSAYWKTAFLMGVIDQKLYEEGMEKGKVTRLASLGSLAKTKETWSFDGENFEIKDKEKSEMTEHIWFAICKRVSDLMEGASCLLGKDFIFYWVDGIYVKNTEENKSIISFYFSKFGYESSVDYIDKIQFNNHDFDVYEKDVNEPKKFSYRFSSESSKRYDKMKELREFIRITSNMGYNKKR